jgi:hypothetical protein
VTADSRAHPPDGTRPGALWAGVLLGPLASLVALQLGYVLAERACATGQMLPLHLGFLGCLLVSLAAGVIARREWRGPGARPATEAGGPEGRSRFLALLGMLSGGTFALTIVAQWSATLFLHPCQ